MLSHLAAGARVLMLSHAVLQLYADHFPIGGATAAGLVAFAIMFGMCGARPNFTIACSAPISLCVTRRIGWQ